MFRSPEASANRARPRLPRRATAARVRTAQGAMNCSTVQLCAQPMSKSMFFRGSSSPWSNWHGSSTGVFLSPIVQGHPNPLPHRFLGLAVAPHRCLPVPPHSVDLGLKGHEATSCSVDLICFRHSRRAAPNNSPCPTLLLQRGGLHKNTALATVPRNISRAPALCTPAQQTKLRIREN